MKKSSRYLRLLFIFSMLISMTGCLHWMHAYQTYRQMNEFDHYFVVSAKEDFTVHFKEPKLFSEDLYLMLKIDTIKLLNNYTTDAKKKVLLPNCILKVISIAEQMI